jgi:hypothetical protein
MNEKSLLDEYLATAGFLGDLPSGTLPSGTLPSGTISGGGLQFGSMSAGTLVLSAPSDGSMLGALNLMNPSEGGI